MTDLELNGPLDLMGQLDLVGDSGGKVMVNGAEAMVEGAKGQATAPVVQPPPPSSPIDIGVSVSVISSLGKLVKAGGKAIVTSGLALQGNTPTWPGMVLPSTGNAAPHQVTANGIAVNVKNDRATIFPNGGSATINQSGQ